MIVCRLCQQEKFENNYQLRTDTKRYRTECKDCLRIYKYKYYKTKEDHFRSLAYQNKFGISLEEYNNLLLLQNNQCKICLCNVQDQKKKLAVDHCHTTGKVRGLLCIQCNVGLGAFKDNINKLNRAKLYLLLHKTVA